MDAPIDLDSYRSGPERTATRWRCRQAARDRMSCRVATWREQALQDMLLAVPAGTWSEAANRAGSLIERYAATPEGQVPQERELIVLVLADLVRLQEQAVVEV